ncbi:MAG TPA: TadE/TadG family type IV pilus assembly protein [Stenomitos sp.]
MLPGANLWGHKADRQDGQAIVEAGLLIPLLVFLLLALAFIGFAIYESQNAVIAARFAAREAAISAMDGAADEKVMGLGVIKEAGTTALRTEYAQRVLGKNRKVEVSAPSWRYEVAVPRTALVKMVPIGPMGRAYVATDKTGRFGLGFIMYGEKVTSKGSWLDSLGKGAEEGSKMVTGKSTSLWDKVGVRAEGYMPGELPVHGAGFGLSEINPWIRKTISGKMP